MFQTMNPLKAICAFCFSCICFVGCSDSIFDQPEYQNAKSDFKRQLVAEEASKILDAAKKYKVQHGGFPDTINDLISRPKAIKEEDWKGPYLTAASVPRDPWKNRLMLEAVDGDDARIIRVRSYGPDGRGPNRDDIVVD